MLVRAFVAGNMKCSTKTGLRTYGAITGNIKKTGATKTRRK